jgi:short-subunit dehydrogenase
MTRTTKTALVTGASAGIGVELARLAAKDGHDLILVARRRDRLETLAAELTKAHGVQVAIIAADLSDPATPATIADRLRGEGKQVDFLINNAGFGSCGPFSTSVLAREVEMIHLNIRALVQMTHLFLPDMLARKSGRILNMASIAGFVPGPYMATYYASKAFVLSFTEALSSELLGSGVTITASCPGPTKTEFSTVAGSERTNLFQRSVADAATVARHAYRAMMAGKVVAIPGLMNKLIAQSTRISPRAWLRAIAAGLNRHRKSS